MGEGEGEREGGGGGEGAYNKTGSRHEVHMMVIMNSLPRLPLASGTSPSLSSTLSCSL